LATVLITGASKGIGKAAAIKFASAGWDLLLVARSTQKLEILSEELKKNGSSVFYQSIDFSDSSQINSGIEKLLSHGIIPSVLINNAGVAWTSSSAPSISAEGGAPGALQPSRYLCRRTSTFGCALPLLAAPRRVRFCQLYKN